ncbi:MAG TPA: DNA methyltransferase [Dehalococcoidia bacterium]|nr:DNA methyltransferase [Dehalococcoidia bacterium]
MASLLQGDAAAGIEPLAGTVDLIYIDPPFDTGADFSFRTQIGDEEVEKEPGILEHLAYRDTWGGGGKTSYLQMLYDRLVVARELLSETGSVYVHIGPQINHLARCVLDMVFGDEYDQREIIWKRVAARSHGRYYPATHDSILFFSKTENLTWNQLYEPLDPSYIASHYTLQDSNGRRFMADNCLNQNPDRPNLRYEWHGHIRTWRWTKERMQELDKEGRLLYTSSGMPRYKRYLDESEGTPLQSVWTDIRPLNSQAKEDTGYDTQKPEALLERIIKASSNEGDLVADFFLGSGTTAAVAHKLGRRWIGCDLGRFAVHTSRKRLLDLGATFDVYNLGKYERSHWQGVTLGDRLRAYVDFILALYRAEPAPGFRHLHGKRGSRAVHVGAVDSPITFAELADVLAECRDTHTSAVDVLGWEWEMGVNDLARKQAEADGVDLRCYQIPNDVMDRRAKQADVRFYSLAYLEAAARVVAPRSVQIALTDFVIPDLDLVPAAVREKVTRWSDYIDYWAVDFDYHDDTFCNGWQAFRTRARRTLDTVSAAHTYPAPGRYTVLVKVVDVFGIDSTRRLEVSV